MKCEKCNNEHDGLYGSGRFCSPSCAHTQTHSKETKLKISLNMKNSINYNFMVESIRKRQPPKILWKCPVCDNEILLIPSEAKQRKYCSTLCYKQDHEGDKKYCTLYRPGPENKGGRNSHKGYYKGIWCDSTFELVWVIYNLEHNIPFERNIDAFQYIAADGKSHNYYPDFKLSDNHYVETKNYLKDNDQYKINQFPHTLTILFEKDLKTQFDYVYQKYGKNLISLYDKMVDGVGLEPTVITAM